MQAGLVAVDLSNQSPKRRKAIIIVGDGAPADRDEALEAIPAANYQRNPIHTIVIGGSSGGEDFMRTLAEVNGGTFRAID